MKYLGFLVIIFLAVTLQAQSFRGSIAYGTSTLNYQIKLIQTADQPAAFFSSIEMNAFEIPCQNTTSDKDSLKFYVFSDYYTYEYKFSLLNNNYEGKLKIYSNETEQLLNSFETDLIRENLKDSDFIERQEMTFTSNNLELSGTLWKPKNPINQGLFFVTSSQGYDRSGTNAEANYFAKLGYTVFNYDKRGTGKSEGNWQSATIEELCSDDMNALQFFSQISSLALVDIGIKGSSQGGTKIPYILSEMRDLAFGISVSCPSGTLLESDLNYWVNRNTETIGSEIEDATALQRKVFEFISGKRSRKNLEKAIKNQKSKSWFVNIWVPDLDQVQIDEKLNYTPIPYFEKIKQPILILQGTLDEIIPAHSHQMIANALTKSGNDNYEIVLLEGASHSMNNVGESDYPYWSKLHSDYLKTVEDWINDVSIH